MADVRTSAASVSLGQEWRPDKFVARRTFHTFVRRMEFLTCAALAVHSLHCCLSGTAMQSIRPAYQGRGESSKQVAGRPGVGSSANSPLRQYEALLHKLASNQEHQVRQAVSPPHPSSPPTATSDSSDEPALQGPRGALSRPQPNSGDSRADAYERPQSAGLHIAAHEPDISALTTSRRLHSQPPRLPNISSAELTTFLARLKGSPLLIYGPFDNPADPTLLTAAALEASQYWSRSIENVRTLLDLMYTGWEQLLLLPFSVRSSRSSFLKRSPEGPTPAPA